MCRSTTPPAATRHPETSAGRATRNQKNDPFSSVPKGSNKAAPVTQGGLFVSTYIAGKITLLGATLLIALDQLGLNVIGNLLVASGLHGKVTRAARDRA